jgi:hypothetical protein
MSDLKSVPADDFEFKPLTKGLGFHPKKEASVSLPSNPGRSSSGSTPALPKAPASASRPLVTPRSLKLETPLPRPETKRTPTPSPSTQAVETILKNLNDKNRSLSFQDKGPQMSPFVQTTPSLAAGFLDALLIVALGLVYLMTLILTLKIDLIKTLTEGDGPIWLATGAVFLGVSFVYTLSQRMFFGFTLGEWAYEQRMGLPEELKKPGYGFKILARQILILGTGVFIVPLLSWAFGRDLAGVSGVCSYRKR